MNVDELLELTRRLDRAEQANKELQRMLIGFALKDMDAKGVARLEKPILNKTNDFRIEIEPLKSGSLKFKVTKKEDANGG